MSLTAGTGRRGSDVWKLYSMGFRPEKSLTIPLERKAHERTFEIPDQFSGSTAHNSLRWLILPLVPFLPLPSQTSAEKQVTPKHNQADGSDSGSELSHPVQEVSGPLAGALLGHPGIAV